MLEFYNKLSQNVKFTAKLISKKLFLIVLAFCLGSNFVDYGLLNNHVYSISEIDGGRLNYFKNDDCEKIRGKFARERQDRISATYSFDDVLKQDSIITENLILEKFEAKNVSFQNIAKLEADGSVDAVVLKTYIGALFG